MAWLDCTPEKRKTPRRAALTLRRKRGEEVPELDPVEVEPALEYLVGYLFEAGPIQGEHELSFQELRAWCACTGVELDDFESTALKQMSRAYLGMLHKGRQPECPNPAIEVVDLEDMEPEAAADHRAKVAGKLNAWLGSVEESHGKGGMGKRK